MQICQASKLGLYEYFWSQVLSRTSSTTVARLSIPLVVSSAKTTSNIAGTEYTNRQRMRVRYRRKRRITPTGSYLSLHLPSWARSAPRTTP